MPSPQAQQCGWQQRCGRHRSSTWSTSMLRGDLHPRGSPSCRTPGALPPTGSPSPSGPSTASRSVGVLDRAAPAASPSAPSPSSAASATPAPLPDRTMGYLSLSVVPLLWGTYNPCIRYLYAEADPLDPASLTAVRTLLSAGALLLPALMGYLVRQGREAWRRNQATREGGSSSSGTDGSGAVGAAHHAPLGATLAATSDGAADGVASAAAAAEEEAVGHVGGHAVGQSEGAGGAAPRSLFAEPLNGTRLGPVLTRTFDSVVLGGLELGLLNFLGTALQVEGLHSTSATRAGFLAEVTAVLTPLVSYLAGYDIPRQMWLAVAVGLVGSTMVAYDTSQAKETPAPAPAAAAPQAGTASTAAPPPATASALSPATAAATTAHVGAGPSLDASSEGSAAVQTAAEVGVAPVAPLSAAPSLSWGPDALGTPELGGALAASAAVPDAAGAAASSPAADALQGSEASLSAAASQLTADAADAASVSASIGDAAAASLSAAADGLAAAVDDAAAAASAAAADVAAVVADSVASSLSTAADAAAAGLPAAAGSALEAVGSGAADATSGVVTAAAEVATAAAAAVATPLAITGGEAYLLLACLFYSICTVRMGIYAPRMDTVNLAAMKKVGLSSMSVMWMAATNLQNGVAPGSVLSFPDLSTRTPISIAVLMYSGLGPGALATFLQVTGLSTVPATTAQVIYSMTPLCTAFFAYLILGGEATGPVAWAGGSLIIVAALMAADAQQKQLRQQQQQLQQ